MKRSADLLAGPFRDELAVPVFAAGTPPDVPAATPTRMAAGLLGLVLLSTSTTATANRCVQTAGQRHEGCVSKPAPIPSKPTGKKAAQPRKVTPVDGGGGSFSRWPRIAADLMP